MQQSMKKMLAGFATDGQAPRNIGVRLQSTLHRIADGHVLVLHFFADSDAFPVVSFGGRADVRADPGDAFRLAVRRAGRRRGDQSDR